MRLLATVILACLLPLQAWAAKVAIHTNLGTLVAELDEQKAPISVANFLRYVDEGFYTGTLFHRVIPGFMIQGGGFTEEMEQKPTHEPISNEANNGLLNLRGTLSMARRQDKDSATSQFFINLNDNPFLDHGVRDYGYAVFGRVVEGMDVLDAIGQVQTSRKGYFQDVPVEPVIITAVERLTN
ncbi:peptidylprolyl isomerase [Balneatrix alpica]|uniref:Peptidyl-prolyl cis-trans isomerase n=1 Tax=Balneatrix alpica TaxID=75684 RepID=A0ABV5ZE01_9GAMM|nr:peptidylprolyl isomerase [Balneatrix alpica]